MCLQTSYRFRYVDESVASVVSKIFPDFRTRSPVNPTYSSFLMMELPDARRLYYAERSRIEEFLMFHELSLNAFLSNLAARTPTPGGGAASALACATGVSQAGMCAAFTMGNEKYKDVELHAAELQRQLLALKAEFLSLMDRDAVAYEAVLAARRLPRKSEVERQLRKAQIEKAEEEATRIPEQILSSSRVALTCTLDLAGICNPNLLADAAVAAWLLEAGARGACLQVRGNLAQRPTGAVRAAGALETQSECQRLSRAICETVMKGMGLPVDTH
jgi:formiminotetrahydrofolate cyclodeaminase